MSGHIFYGNNLGKKSRGVQLGKIYNALEKHRNERKVKAYITKMNKADWDALIQYNKRTGKLNLRNTSIIKDPGTIHRLLANKMILPDGTLTSAAKKKCAEVTQQLKISLADQPQEPNKNKKDVGDDDTSISSDELREFDWNVLFAYDRKTGHLVNYNPETGELEKGSIEIAKDRGVIQRLLKNDMIYSDGKLTPKGLQECEKREGREKKPLSEELTLQETGSDQTDVSNNSVVDDKLNKHTSKFHSTLSILPVENKRKSVNPAEVDKLVSKYDEPEPSKSKASKKERPTAKTDAALYKYNAIDKNLVSLLAPQSFEAEQFKILRTNLLFPISGNAPRSILVTSAAPGEGKSFVASNLAISVASGVDKHVLLMDCDLRRPALHKQFGFGNVAGLSDYLSRGTALKSMLLRTKLNKLSILPAGPPPDNPSELLSSELMSALIKEVTERYSDRLIIIDTPPLKLTAETGALVRNVDGILVVIKYGKTSSKLVQELIEKIGKEKILGSIINFFDIRSSGFYAYRAYRKYNHRYYK